MKDKQIKEKQRRRFQALSPLPRPTDDNSTLLRSSSSVRKMAMVNHNRKGLTRI